MSTLLTPRLAMRQPVATDAAFILRLLNDPGWLRYIGDRGVRTEADALGYIEDRLLAGFRQHGFGLWLTEPREGGAPLGLCGLLKRPELDDVDLGFAFLPEARGQGLAYEAARRSLEYAACDLRLHRVVGITLPDNAPSSRLLQKLGMTRERTVQMHEDSVDLYAIDLQATPTHTSSSRDAPR
jgi:[ribosomal protein S5]-alanine N-acetyltransferase